MCCSCTLDSILEKFCCDFFTMHCIYTQYLRSSTRHVRELAIARCARAKFRVLGPPPSQGGKRPLSALAHWEGGGKVPPQNTQLSLTTACILPIQRATLCTSPFSNVHWGRTPEACSSTRMTTLRVERGEPEGGGGEGADDLNPLLTATRRHDGTSPILRTQS